MPPDHGNMLTFDKGSNRFNFRVGAIAIHEGKLLLTGDRRCNYLFLPGGRVEWSEDTATSLKREIYEELGVAPEIKRLAWVAENFFQLDGFGFHELSFYYEIGFPADLPLLAETGDFRGVEPGDRWFYRWANLAELKTLTIKPSFVPIHLPLRGNAPEHIVHRDTIRPNR